MSLPSDLQDALTNLHEVMRRHDVARFKLSICDSKQKESHIPRVVKIEDFHVYINGSKTWELSDFTLDQTAEAFRDRILSSVREQTRKRDRTEEQILSRKREVIKYEKSIKSLRALIPSPLVDLARCADGIS